MKPTPPAGTTTTRVISPGPQGDRARLSGNPPAKTAFSARLRQWLSCPNLAKDADEEFAATPADVVKRPAPKPQPKKWIEEPGRPARLGGGVKLALRTADDLCAATLRISDMGLLVEARFWVSGYGFRLTSDLLSPDSWLPFLKPRSPKA